MDIVNRAKNILLTPKAEWEVIANENDNHMKVTTGYLIILATVMGAVIGVRSIF